MDRSITFPWHKFPMLFPLLFLVLGIISGRYSILCVSLNTALTISLSLLVLSACVLIIFRKSTVTDLLYTIMMSLACVLFGYTCYYTSHHPYHDGWYGHHLHNSKFLQVRITDPYEEKSRSIRYRTEIISIYSEENRWKKAFGNIDVYIYKNDNPSSLQINDIITIPSKHIRAISHSMNPYSFNYKEFAALKNKYHQAFLSYQDILVNYMAEESAQSWVQKVNKSILEGIYNNVSDSMTASMMAAVIINERADMDQDIWRDYSRTGVAHIIAISGMHITLFVSILFYILFFIKSRKNDYLRYSIALILVWVYILLTGMPPSAVRAGIMFTIIGAGIIIRRPQIPINTLLATAFISLIFVPQWLWDVGFQLSFLSVLAILVYFDPVKRHLNLRSRFLDFIWTTIAVSISVQILLTPLMIYYFNQFTFWSVIANIPAAVYSTAFMIITLIIITAGQTSADISWLGDINTYITIQFNKIIHFFSDISPDFFHRLHIDGGTLLMSYVLITLFSLFLYSKRKIYLWSSAAVFTAICGIIMYQYHQTTKQQYINIYNTSSNTIIDIVSGHHVQRFSTQLISADDSVYCLIPHDIHRNLTVVSTSLLNENKTFLWKEYSFLILVDEWNYSETQEQANDYIILANKDIKLTDKILNLLEAENWIISSEISQYYSQKFIRTFIQKNLNYIYIRESGAMKIEE